MRFVEFQLTAAKFADMFRESVRALDLSTLSTLSSGPMEVLLDRVEIGPAAIWTGEAMTHTVVWEDDFDSEQSTWVDATSTGIVQDLILHSKVLTGRGTLEPQLNDLPGIPASVTMLLSGRKDRDGKPAVFLTPAYVTVSLPSLPGVADWDRQYVQSIMETRIRSLLPERPIPMPIEKFRKLGLTIVDVGVATDPARTRLAIRFQSLPRPESIVNEWRSFHAGSIADPFSRPGVPDPGAFEWAVVLDAHTVSEMIRSGVDEGLKKHADMIHLISGIGADWQGAADNGHVVVRFHAEATVGAPIDPAFDVRSDVFLEARPDGLLEARTTTTVTLSGADAAIAALIINLLLPVVGPGVLLAISSTFSGTTVGGLADTLLVGFLTNVPVPFHPDFKPGSEWMCESVDDATQVCTMSGSLPFSMGDGRVATLRLADIFGASDHMVERGRVVTPQPEPDPRIDDIVVGMPSWEAPTIECGHAGAAGPETLAALKDPLRAFSAKASIGIVPGFGRPVEVQAATVVSTDAAGVVASVDIRPPTAVDVTFHSNELYESDPYRFAILVQTTGGVRLVWLDAIPAMTPDVAKWLVVTMIGESAECFKLMDSFYERFHRFNPKWAVDPGIDAIQYVQMAWGVFQEDLAPRLIERLPEGAGVPTGPGTSAGHRPTPEELIAIGHMIRHSGLTHRL